jgi:chloramphenicol 3-O-phosphotransferase
MSAAERKALFLRNVPGDLVREAKAAAARRGETLTTIVAEALARSLAVADDRGEPDGLQGDIAWYRRSLPDLLRRYRGQHVAVVGAAVVDHDRDFGALAARVFKRFGNRSVYMPRVQTDEPVARIRSPRRSRP